MSVQRSVGLYRDILRAATGFRDYNFRNYFVRRAKEDWHSFVKKGASEQEAAEFLKKQEAELEVLKRQSIISGLYPSPAYDGSNKE